MAQKDLGQLKQAFLDADQEYQFAIASGDKNRLTEALGNWRRTWNAFNRAKQAEFNKRSQLSNK